MKWITRRHIHVNRTATSWLIRRFIDPQAEILFVDPPSVARLQESLGAVGFDAPGACYPHRDDRGRCSFEVLVAERRPEDTALLALARIVHGADFSDAAESRPESAGLRTISAGFTEVETDDAMIVARATFLYDSLYAALGGTAP